MRPEAQITPFCYIHLPLILAVPGFGYFGSGIDRTIGYTKVLLVNSGPYRASLPTPRLPRAMPWANDALRLPLQGVSSRHAYCVPLIHGSAALRMGAGMLMGAINIAPRGAAMF